jgi:integrase
LEPNGLISASTGRCRLVAAQRFAGLCGDQVGIADVERFPVDLDSLLPTHSRRDWHSAGTIVAGTRARRRPLGPTLAPADLERIVTAVTARVAPRARRDRVLVALHCYSGLRPDELFGLRWSQVMVDTEHGMLSIQLRRRGRWLCLPVVGRAAGLLLAWRRTALGGASPSGEQHVLPRSEHGDQPLTSRAVREIVRRACERAGFPLATATDLRAAFACWVRTHGLSDHETAAVLGLQQVRSLDRLLARHRAMDAQRRVREVCGIP